MLVQIAKRLGARVIGTVSNEEKAREARQAGADEVILYTQTDFVAETKRLMKKGQQDRLLQQMDDEGTSFARMLTEPAAREAFGAFMDKRTPDFSKL